MVVKTYKTISGDTWDQIAYAQYGDSKMISPILKANRMHIGTTIFEAGVELIIPVAEEKRDENIAPWRR